MNDIETILVDFLEKYSQEESEKDVKEEIERNPPFYLKNHSCITISKNFLFMDVEYIVFVGIPIWKDVNGIVTIDQKEKFYLNLFKK